MSSRLTRYGNGLVRFATRHSLVMLALMAVIAAPLGLLVATAAPPDPGVTPLPMSWQREARPVLNTGVNAEGQTLDQWTRGTNAAGQTLEQWTIAGNDPARWVADPRTQRRPEDWRPMVTRTVKAGGLMYVLRYMEFRNKLAEPMIHRLMYCGDGVSGVTPFDLGPIRPPKLTQGPAVANHPTRIPADILPPGVDAMACEYRARADFIMNPIRTATMYFPAVKVTIVR